MKQSEEMKDYDRDFRSLDSKFSLAEKEQEEVLHQIHKGIKESKSVQPKASSPWKQYVALAAASLLFIMLALPLLSSIIQDQTGNMDKEEHIGRISESQPLAIKNSSKVVMFSGALTFAAFLENNTSEDSVPFYVKFEIQDEWLRSKLEQGRLVVGEGIQGENLAGRLFTVEAATAFFQAGGTLMLTEEIDEKKLKEVIEQGEAVKVTLLTEDKEVITAGFITNFSEGPPPGGYSFSEYKQIFAEAMEKAAAMETENELLNKWIFRVISQDMLDGEADLTETEIIQSARQSREEQQAWKVYAKEVYGIQASDEEIDRYIEAGPDTSKVPQHLAVAEVLGMTLEEYNHSFDRDIYETAVVFEKLIPELEEKYGSGPKSQLIEKYKEEVKENITS